MPVCSTCGTTYSSTVRICVHDGTPLTADRTDDKYLGTLLDGKYRIDAFINAGGMGSLYRALHVMLDKTVAVKVIRPELVTSDEIVARFQREARAASTLEHPNIVSVYDLGQTPEGTLYIAMEFIDGPSLKEVIRKNGPLTPRETIDILRQVASALTSAHRKQIVHRDLKSDNLMLESEDGRTVVKLVDFGIAKTFDDSTQLTAAGYMLGTPHYMSPEQAAGKPVDHRTDLYSLGVILYEMLTGKVPFGDAALTSILVRLATEVPPPPSSRRPDGSVPPSLDAVAMRCLEKDPERRFQSASEFAEALDRASADIDSVPGTPAAPMPLVEKTLIRPATTRQTAVPTIPPATPVAESVQPVPSARPRAGLTGTHVVVALFVLIAIGAAIVGGMRLMNAQQESRPTATIQQPAPSPTPEPAPPPPAPQVPPAAAPVSEQPPSIDNGRGRVASRNENVSTPPAAAATPPPPRAPTPPRPDPTVARTPPPVAQTPTAVAPAVTPAPNPAAPTPTPTRSAPSASVMCQGVADVCEAIRSETVRALEENQLSTDIEITVRVTLAFERPTTRLGVPSFARTYSVEMTGTSRGTALAMPGKRAIEFDALDRRTLQDHARQLASATVDAVRAARGRN